MIGIFGHLRALFCALAGFVACASSSALAQWPERTVTVVSPYPPGGTNDVVGRLFTERLRIKLGQSIIVDNRAGAGGVIGSAQVASAKPDGYTLLTANSAALVLQPLINSQARYDPTTSFTPIVRYGNFYMTLAVRPDLGVGTVAEFVALAKSKPGQLTYGSAGLGSIGHFAGGLLSVVTGIDVRHIPYRGSAQALQDLLGGRIDFMIDPAVLPYQEQLKVLVTSAPRRQASHPQVPTAAEAGIPGFNLSAWYGLVGPPGLPQEIVDRLATAVTEIAREESVVEIAGKSGVVIEALSGPAFTREIERDFDQYRSVKASAGIPQLN